MTLVNIIRVLQTLLLIKSE